MRRQHAVPARQLAEPARVGGGAALAAPGLHVGQVRAGEELAGLVVHREEGAGAVRQRLFAARQGQVGPGAAGPGKKRAKAKRN